MTNYAWNVCHWNGVQQYIERKDYLVYVLGGKVFACQIESDADDNRYAKRMGKNVSIVLYELPKVKNKCKMLCCMIRKTAKTMPV